MITYSSSYFWVILDHCIFFLLNCNLGWLRLIVKQIMLVHQIGSIQANANLTLKMDKMCISRFVYAYKRGIFCYDSTVYTIVINNNYVWFEIIKKNLDSFLHGNKIKCTIGQKSKWMFIINHNSSQLLSSFLSNLFFNDFGCNVCLL